jgi:outer membrane biosynthesis protein TonB
MQNTNWPAFGIGMAAGVALSISLYFGWTLLRPAPREADNTVMTANLPMPLDENALVAANAERPANAMRPPPQLQPEAEPTPEPAPVVRPEPPVVRPTPRPEPYDPPPEDDPPPDEDLDKPTE